MKVIVLLAQKGGVGKSTLARHWAVIAQEQTGLKTAIIDLDPQQTATKWFLRRHNQRHLDTPPVLQANKRSLRAALDACKEEECDVVFIDTPGKSSDLNVIAAKHADVAAIPCAPKADDIDTIKDTLEVTKLAGTPAAYIFLNSGAYQGQRNQLAAEVINKSYGVPVCPTPIAHRTSIHAAFEDGRTIFECSPSSKGAQEVIDSWNWLAKMMRLGGKKRGGTK